MIRLVLVLTCGMAVALASPRAQTPARDAPQSVAPPTGTASLAGVVRNIDGTPVRRATVTITGDMRLERLTVADDEGRFSFANLPTGRFTVTAEKAGYPQTSYGAKKPFRTGSGVFVQEGQQVRDLVLTLARGGAITGTVFDERGEPMPGVPVMAWEIRTSLAGTRTLDYAGEEPVTVITDDRGVYRVFGLAPGDYTIGTSWYYSGLGYDVRVPTDAEIRAAFQAAAAASVAGAPAPTPLVANPPRHNYTRVFAPGVVDPLAAATFTLAPGEVREGVDLHMQFVPMSEITGDIVTPDGRPVTAQLTITGRSPVQALNTTQVRPGLSDAHFTSGSLSPGRYTVMAQVPGQAGAPPLWASADVMVAGDQPVPVTLVLQPALTVTGRVVFEKSTLEPPRDLTQLSIWLRPVGPAGGDTETTVNAAGEMTITGVIPGQYIIRGSVPAGAALPAPGAAAWTVRSVVLDGRDVTDKPFEIGAGGASALTVTFTDLVSELSGTLTTPSGAPATDYFVIAIPADRAYWTPSSRRIVSARPDGEGRYVFRRLPAGEYRIAVTTDLVPRDLQDVSALEQLTAQSVPVTLATGERKTLDLRTSGGG